MDKINTEIIHKTAKILAILKIAATTEDSKANLRQEIKILLTKTETEAVQTTDQTDQNQWISADYIQKWKKESIAATTTILQKINTAQNAQLAEITTNLNATDMQNTTFNSAACAKNTTTTHQNAKKSIISRQTQHLQTTVHFQKIKWAI
jgi:hypothetical protein